MARTTDEVTTRLRVERGRQFQSDMNRASKSVRGFGAQANWAAARSKMAANGMRSLSRSASTFSHLAVRGFQGASLAVGAFGVYALKTGVQFNATMQQNQIAFTQFLGSAGKAKSYLNDLYQIAAHTPFELTQVNQGAQKLLAFGFNAKTAKRTLVDLADVASGMGKSGADIDQMVTALGQIQAKGRLQGDEMLQLMESGIPALDIMAKKLGKTGAETSKLIQEGKVDSKTAIDAILAYSEKKFGGMAKKQSQTLTGQWSTAKDNFAQLTGAMTSGLNNPLTSILRHANHMMSRLVTVWQGKGRSFQEKMQVTRDTVYKFLKPYAKYALEALKRAHLDQRLADAINWATPRIVDAFAAAAPRAAKAFVSAFMKMNFAGKIFALAYLAHKLGAFSIVGRMAADRVTSSYKSTILKRKAGFEGAGKLSGGWFGTAFKLAAGVGIASAIAQATNVENADPLLFLHPPSAGISTAQEKAATKGAKGVGKASKTPFGVSKKTAKKMLDVYGGAAALDEWTRENPGKTPPERDLRPLLKHHVHTHVYLDSREVGSKVLKRARDRARRR